MNETINDQPAVIHEQDIASDAFERLLGAQRIAWDIETTGLDWEDDQVVLCQLWAGKGPAHIVRIERSRTPERLPALLSEGKIVKVFHHAMFDLRFMCAAWGVVPRSVQCTKVAAKILHRDDGEKASLQNLVRLHLGLHLSKELRTSDWTSRNLTQEQIQYAAGDVLHLLSLMNALRDNLSKKGTWWLAQACFRHIPAQVALDLRGIFGVFDY